MFDKIKLHKLETEELLEELNRRIPDLREPDPYDTVTLFIKEKNSNSPWSLTITGMWRKDAEHAVHLLTSGAEIECTIKLKNKHCDY